MDDFLEGRNVGEAMRMLQGVEWLLPTGSMLVRCPWRNADDCFGDVTMTAPKIKSTRRGADVMIERRGCIVTAQEVAADEYSLRNIIIYEQVGR